MTIAARPPDWKRYLWHDGDVDFDSTSKASRSATVTIRSGGPRRDASLNPIVARVREELLRLAAEHGAAPKELDKAAPKKVSSLAFSTAAKATLRKGYTSAWASGITDSGLSFIDPQALAAAGLTAWDLTDPQNIDPAQLDAAGITEADLADAFDNGEGDVTQATDNQSGFLDGLGALLAIGGLTAAAIDARMGLYAASLNPLYEQGFESGVGLQGTIAQATWHTSGDEGVCDLCDSRDGESWQGDEDHPYPGEGGFGEVCDGGPNCRCELWYELIPASEADVAPGDTVDTSGDFVDGEVVTSADYAAAAVPDLTKYSPEQERVPAGGPGGGQFAGGAAPPDPEKLRSALKSWVGYRVDDGMNPPYVRDYHARIRQALAGQQVMIEGTYGPDVPAPPALAEAHLQEGRVLLAAIANAPVTSEPLYRGLKMTDEQKDELVSRMKVGGKVDLNLCSWSTDIKAAGEYTGKGLGGRFSSPRVIMQLVGDKQALNVGATPLAWEKERLTDGRFTVLNVAERVNEQSPYRHSVDPSNPDAPPPMETVITLEQDSVFHDPVQTYGTKVGKVKLGDAHFDPWLEQFLDDTMRPTAASKYEGQPRDERGRFGEGKESDAAAPEAKPGLGEAQTRVSEQYTYGERSPEEAGVRPVRKYSEDQPRDAAGRFAEEGASWVDPREANAAAWDRVTGEIAKQGMGNCYQAADTLALRSEQLGLKNATVVQAMCVGQGAIEGINFGHSWLEADGPGIRLAYDYSSGNREVMPASLYRALGQATDIHEFSTHEALVKMASTRHYGPW